MEAVTYAQITLEERYASFALRKLGYTGAAIAQELGRHRSTISREVRRNAWRQDGRTYRPVKAQEYTNQRRRVSRETEGTPPPVTRRRRGRRSCRTLDE